MDVTSWAEYFIRIAPALVIAAYGFWIMLGLYRDERAANTELQNYIRESDKENLKILKEFKTLLDGLILATQQNTNEILETISEEAKEVCEHLDSRIAEITAKIDHKG